MHYNNVVVTILDAKSKKPFREYGHKRSGTNSSVDVVIPFDTEYMFKFKIGNGTRYRLDLKIDGTLVTDSIIVTDGAVLERFVESAKRFKFVRADNEAVADPDSEDNGKIEITLYQEKPLCLIPYKYVDNIIWDKKRDLEPWTWTWTYGDLMCSSQAFSSNSVLRSKSLDFEKGATVEGSKSDQEFISSDWLGDYGAPLTFVFNVKGKNKSNDVKGTRYCHNCGVQALADNSKFCHRCGTKLVV